MSPKRLSLLATAVAGGLMILGWSQTWFEVQLQDGRILAVPGTAVAAGVLAAGVAALALAAALTIAPRLLRYVLGALAVIVGAVGAAVAVVAATDPLRASAGTVTEETGLAGIEAIRLAVDSVGTTPWPWAAVAGGMLAMVAGVGVLVMGRRWPTAAARYDRTRSEPDDWDALTGGDDPTR